MSGLIGPRSKIQPIKSFGHNGLGKETKGKVTLSSKFGKPMLNHCEREGDRKKREGEAGGMNWGQKTNYIPNEKYILKKYGADENDQFGLFPPPGYVSERVVLPK